MDPISTAFKALDYLGRLDHQIKLRGFRIELGEIEGVLAQHPSVQSAVVVVREDASGDRRLCAYVVAREGTSPGASEMRGFAESKLPGYMVPSVFVTLPELPLTPSGKIDRKALPAPDPTHREPSSSYVAPRTPTEAVLVEIWETLFETHPIGVRDNFFSLGGHSMLAVRLMALIEERLGRRLPLMHVFSSPTVGELAGELSISTNSPHDSPLVPLRRTGSKPPFFCVHAGGGTVLCYEPLARALGPDQPFFGLQARPIEAGREDEESVEAMAERYLAAVRAVQPEGPYYLGGWSFGGLVAFEMARRLLAEGHTVGALVLLDTVLPRTSKGQDRQAVVLELLPGILAQFGLTLTPEELVSLSLEEAIVEAAARGEAAGILPRGRGVALLQGMLNFLLASMSASRRYELGRLDGSLVLLRAREGDIADERYDWSSVCATPIELRWVPGNHGTLASPPHVEEVARVLQDVLDQAVAASPHKEVRLVDPGTSRDARAPGLLGSRLAGAAFPVRWEDPDDAQKMWIIDQGHNFGQLRGLDFEMRLSPMHESSSRMMGRFGLPLRSRSRLVHGFPYHTMALRDGISDEAVAVGAKEIDANFRRLTRDIGDLWEHTWLPAIQAKLAELSSFDLRGASLPALALRLSEVRREVGELWDMHFTVLSASLVAICDFEDMYCDLFPDATSFAPHDLLGGFSNKTLEGNLRLRELGHAAARTPELAELITRTEPAQLPAALAATSPGQAFWGAMQEYLHTYGERSDDLYIDKPTWIEDPSPVLHMLREVIVRPERDLAAELLAQQQRREARISEARARLASYPRAVLDEFDVLLRAAQVANVLSEDHHFWLDCKITYHARRVCLEIGRRLTELGTLDRPDDVFDLTVAELSTFAEPGALAEDWRARVAARKAAAAPYAGVTPPPFLGVPRPFPSMESVFMKASFKFSGAFMGPPSAPGELKGMPGSRGRVTGPARIVRTLRDAEHLRAGEVLVASTTLPSWTPFFAIAAGVVTAVGGILSHAAVVAREYGIPAVVGATGVMEALHDGQHIEVDGDSGVVRVVT